MRLYLIRHGKAQNQSPTGLDEDRALTPRGQAQAAWLGAELQKDTHPPKRLFCSPATRARETARLLGEKLGLTAEIEARLSLKTTPSAVIELIESQEGTEAVAMVGHNPTLSTVVDVLCQGATGSRHTVLRTGETAVLDLAKKEGQATLVGRLRAETE